MYLYENRLIHTPRDGIHFGHVGCMGVGERVGGGGGGGGCRPHTMQTNLISEKTIAIFGLCESCCFS